MVPLLQTVLFGCCSGVKGTLRKILHLSRLAESEMLYRTSPRTCGYAPICASLSRLVSRVHSGSRNGTFWRLEATILPATQNFTPLLLSGQWDVVDVVFPHAWVCHNICPEEPSCVQCPETVLFQLNHLTTPNGHCCRSATHVFIKLFEPFHIFFFCIRLHDCVQ